MNSPTKPQAGVLSREVIRHVESELEFLRFKLNQRNYPVNKEDFREYAMEILGAVIRGQKLFPTLTPSGASQPEPVRCMNCDDTGDVHSADGEWRGICHCQARPQAGASQQAAPEPAFSVGDSVIAPGNWLAKVTAIEPVKYTVEYGNGYVVQVDATKLAPAPRSKGAAPPAATEPAPVADERAAFDASDFEYPPVTKDVANALLPDGFNGRWNKRLQDYFEECAWLGWQARAALSQPVGAAAEPSSVSGDPISALRQEGSADGGRDVGALLTALRFYARGEHYIVDDDKFDSVSGEPQNWQCSTVDDDSTMFEDGAIARAALLGNPVSWIDGGEDETPQPIEGEKL